jgi:hypothetical protein
VDRGSDRARIPLPRPVSSPLPRPVHADRDARPRRPRQACCRSDRGEALSLERRRYPRGGGEAHRRLRRGRQGFGTA